MSSIKGEKNSLLGNKRMADESIEESEKMIKKIIKKVTNLAKKHDPSFKFNNNDIQNFTREINNRDTYTLTIEKLMMSIIPSKDWTTIFEGNFSYTKQPIQLHLSLPNKRRAYDIDSNKKFLRKNVWNFVEDTMIFPYTDITNIKSIDDEIKHNTNKHFEKNELMDKKILDLYEKHYGLNKNTILSKLKKEIVKPSTNRGSKKNEIIHLSKQEIENNKSKILENLKKTFKDCLIEYRNSKQFMEDAKKGCKNDKLKLEAYIKVAKKYLNYLQNSDKKANFNEIEDDEDFTQDFDNQVKEIENLISTEELRGKTVLTNTSANSVNDQSNLGFQLPTPDSSLNKVEYIFREFQKLNENEKHELRQMINNGEIFELTRRDTEEQESVDYIFNSMFRNEA